MFLIRFIRSFILSLLILFAWGMLLPRAGEGKRRPRPRLRKRALVAQQPAAKVEVIAEPRVLVFGNRPVLLDEHDSTYGQISTILSQLSGAATTDQYLWTCFSLHSKNSLTPRVQGTGADAKPIDVTITATGLGPSAFAIPDANGCPSASKTPNGPAQMCKVFSGPGGGWTNSFGCWQSVLTLPLDQQQEVIGVRIPVGLVRQPGNAVEGKIIIDEALHKPLEVPLKIERPSDPLNTGFQWFFGFAIPALLSFIIGYVALKLNTKVSSRTEQLRSFTTFKDDQYDVLDAFFTNFYSGAYDANPKDPRSIFGALRKEMRAKKILNSIPHKERKKLETALNLCQEQQIQESLSILFNEWRESIESQKLTR